MDAPVARSESEETKVVRAWDLPTRLFHWSLVALITGAWASASFSEALHDATLRLHRWTGYTILVLLVWRLIWGFVGAPTSRFFNFLSSPLTAFRYGLDLVAGRTRHYLGHNPLGAWMILALLMTVLAQAGIGLFTSEHDDLAAGPLARLVADDWAKPIRHWHHLVFNRVLLPLIGLHIVANILYGLVKRDPLVEAMVTGVKPAGHYVDGAIAVTSAPARALLCVVVAAAVVLGGITLAGGRL